jgi:hypothetical protein
LLFISSFYADPCLSFVSKIFFSFCASLPPRNHPTSSLLQTCVDCVWKWGPWSSCTNQEQFMTRSSVVLQNNQTSEGVANCPNFTQTTACGTESCKCFGGIENSGDCGVNSPQDCARCNSGRYLAQDPQTSLCKFCEYGKYQQFNNHDRNTCKACKVGKYTQDASTACTTCGEGKYQNTINYEYSCKRCPHGKYQSQNYGDPSSCQYCGKDQYTPNAESVCRYCGQGRYQDNDENTEYSCKMCEAGRHYFFDSIYARGCKTCTAGRYTDDNHEFATQESCNECPNGRYNLDEGTNLSLHNSVDTCRFCDKGYDYRSAPGHSPAEDGCLICQAGRYQDLGKP